MKSRTCLRSVLLIGISILFTLSYAQRERVSSAHMAKIHALRADIPRDLNVELPDVISLIPKGKIYHITNLIEDAKNNGKKIGVFPIDDDSWIDIGQWTEYQKAVEWFNL